MEGIGEAIPIGSLSKPRCNAGRFLKFRSRKQVSEVRLEELRLSPVRCRDRLAIIGDHGNSLRVLIAGKPFAFLP